MLLLVYVDHVVVTGNNESLILKLITVLHDKFSLKDLSNLGYFLGIQVSKVDYGLLFTQANYVDEILKKLNMLHLNSAPSPATLGHHLSLSDGTPLHNPFIYRSTVEALQYLTHTRPNISYIVNHLSQFSQATD